MCVCVVRARSMCIANLPQPYSMPGSVAIVDVALNGTKHRRGYTMQPYSHVWSFVRTHWWNAKWVPLYAELNRFIWNNNNYVNGIIAYGFLRRIHFIYLLFLSVIIINIIVIINGISSCVSWKGTGYIVAFVCNTRRGRQRKRHRATRQHTLFNEKQK